MASDPQGPSAEHLAAALLQHQQQVDAQMTNLQKATLQLMEQLGQNLPQSAAAQQMATQPFLMCPHGRLLEKFGGGPGSIPAFTAQCEMFVTGQMADFPTDCMKVTFVLSLLKEAGAKWEMPRMEGNNLVPDKLSRHHV